MMKKWLVCIFSLFLLGGCQFAAPGAPEEEGAERRDSDEGAVNSKATVLAEQLRVPWDIEKQGDVFYITEREGRIVRIENGKRTRETLHVEKEIRSLGEGGLLGFMLDPNFSDNETAYIYHTYEENGTLYNRVVRVRKEGDAWRETSVLLDRIPGGRTHNGGRMSIGPDGKLYVTTGDAGDSALAQDVDSLAGKILRLELNGKIPEDNPFADSYVYSYGHRNPQGLAWSADGKRMYSSEHGSSAYDELNVIEAEGNYGWPTVRGDEKREGMRGPLAHSGTNTWAPSGIAYHEGALYVTGLRGSMLFRFDLDRETTDVLLQGEGRLRDVYIEAPYVYVITNNTDGRGDPNKQDDRLLKLLLPE